MTPAVRQGILIALVVLGIWFYETIRPEPQPPGVLAEAPPSIVVLDGAQAPTFTREGYRLVGLAKFEAKARVLGVERYAGERDTQVAPLDIALGWARMSDSTNLRNVDVAQAKREVLYKSYDPALPDSEVQASVFNIHVIASDPEVDKKLRALRTGHLVELNGYLVEAQGTDGWRWRGSARAPAPVAPGNVLWAVRADTFEAPRPSASK